MKKMRKRLVSWLLCAAMVLAQCPQIAFAEETQTGGCEHHKFHDEDCGYIEGTLEIPCIHDHTEECFRTVTQCVHVHDESCYGGDEDIPGEATPSDARERKAENCAHVCDAESGCVTEIPDCSHEKGEHDEACGYVPAVEGAPCGYVCEICEIELATPPNAKPGMNGETLLITGWEWVDGEEIQYSQENGRWELALPGVSRENQADFDTVVSMLPEGIYAELEGADETEEIGLSGWKCDAYQLDGDEQWPVTGTYTFRGILPEGYGLAEDAKPLKVVVDLGGARLLEGDTGDFALTSKDGEALKPGEDYTFEGDVLTIKTSRLLTISMAEDVTVPTSQRIVVNVSGGKADITLKNVKIDVSEKNSSPFEIQDGTACQITLLGDNTLKVASANAGLYVPEEAELTITKESIGRLYAESGGSGAAGIGGITSQKAGTIIIAGGTIRAVGGAGGAGIGGGANSTFQEIKITGGNITAQGRGNINGGAGIGDGQNNANPSGAISSTVGMIQAIGGTGAAGIGKGCGDRAKRPTFSTENGKAVIFASSIEVADKDSDPWTGMIFNGKDGVLRGAITLDMDAEMPKDSRLMISGYGNSLTIENNVTFRNHGTITIGNGGQLINRGAIENYGTIIENGGTLTNNGTIFRPSSSASVTFSKGGVTLDQNTATYGDTITITATVSGKENTRSALARSAEENTADFYLGDSTTRVKLNTNTVSVRNGTAKLEIPLANRDEIKWGIGDNKNTITVDFGRSKESDNAAEGLLGQTVTGQLTIEKATPTITVPPTVVQNSKLIYGVTFGEMTLKDGIATGVNGSPVDGKFAWEASKDEKPNAGTNNYDVKFTPDNNVAQYYTPATKEVSVTVKPASLQEAVNVSITNKVVYNGSDQWPKVTLTTKKVQWFG